MPDPEGEPPQASPAHGRPSGAGRFVPPEPPELPGPDPPDRSRADASDGIRWPVLATRNARLLLGTRLAGQASDGMLQAALGSFVLFSPERQATAAQVAATFALLLLPYSLIGPFAGVLLDRWSRVGVLVVANLARAGTTLWVASLVADDRDGLDLGVAVLVSLGFGRLVLAGLSASLPHVVPSRHLVTANALFPTAGTLAAATATVTGLLLTPRLGPDAATTLVLVVAVGLVVAALIARFIPHDDLGPDPDDPARTRRLTSDLLAVAEGMLDGIRHVHQRPPARRALGVVLLHRLAFGALLVDVLLLVRNTLNEPSEADAALADFSMTAGGASVGALLAAVATPRLAERLGVTRWAAVTLVVAAGIGPAALSSQALWLLVVGSFAMGFSGQAVKIAGDTVLQREIADDYRGRVFAFYDVVLNVALVSGMVLTALAVPASGISPALWIGIGALLLATAAWSLRPAPGHG